jgi:hypothetical protein
MAADNGKPSFSLLCAYVSFLLAVVSLIMSHKSISNLPATGAAIALWVIAMVFYRIRNLDKAKIDIEKKTLELDGEDEAPPKA